MRWVRVNRVKVRVSVRVKVSFYQAKTKHIHYRHLYARVVLWWRSSVGHSPWIFPPRTCSPGHFPRPDNSPSIFTWCIGHSPLPPPPCATLYKPINRNLKLAITRIPDPNRSGRRVLTITLTQTDPWGLNLV